MAEFLIKVADERGHVSEHIESARSEAEARDRIAQQGLLVITIKARGLTVGGKVAIPSRRRIKQGQFVIFNQQMVTLLKAGLPILTALDLLGKQQKDEFFKKLLIDVRSRVKSGELLSEAFEHQAVFQKLYTTTLLAGEKSGNLDEVLSRFVHFQRMGLSFRKKLKASLIYPTLLIGMVIIMLTFLITFVVPRFAELYDTLGGQLPAATQFMLALGKLAQKYLFVFVGGVAAIGYGLWRWGQTDNGAWQIDRVRTNLPLLGMIWVKYQVSMFTRMMSTLLTGGLPLVPALETAGQSIQSREVANAVTAAAKMVSEGQPLARSLAESKRFPVLSVEMIEVGESTGALPQMLASVADFYEEDVENALTAALSLIEPLILIFMAFIVGFVLISLYLPIFKLGAGMAGG
jgi:type IV pilus assembly protein PilC